MDAASEKLTPATYRKALEQLRSAALGVSEEAAVNAFNAGQKAKQHGWARVSPYYEKPAMEACFFAGYDADETPLQRIEKSMNQHYLDYLKCSRNSNVGQAL